MAKHKLSIKRYLSLIPRSHSHVERLIHVN